MRAKPDIQDPLNISRIQEEDWLQLVVDRRSISIKPSTYY